jgi:branched-chain amino acid transport system ATP-binding protein
VTALVLDKVCKSFGGVTAARDVTLAVPPGRVTGLIGPNGAGKTTLVNLITGMLPVTSGTIRFGDADITREAAHEVSRRGFARTFQNIRLLKEATVIDNIMVGFQKFERAGLLAALAGLPSARRETERSRAGAVDLLRRFGMQDFAYAPAGSLPYGHQRRVEMMRALATAPTVLLLDEPVAGMNDVEAGSLGEIFSGLAQEGMGILLIEHNIRFVTRLCAQVHVLDTGRIIAAGTPEAVMADAGVIAAYLGT